MIEEKKGKDFKKENADLFQLIADLRDKKFSLADSNRTLISNCISEFRDLECDTSFSGKGFIPRSYSIYNSRLRILFINNRVVNILRHTDPQDLENTEKIIFEFYQETLDWFIKHENADSVFASWPHDISRKLSKHYRYLLEIKKS